MMKQQEEGPLTASERNICANAQLLRARAKQEDGRGWSLADVAKQMEDSGALINPASLSRLEKGERRPRYGEVVALARVFGHRPDELSLPPEILQQRPIREAFIEWATASKAENDAYLKLSLQMHKARAESDPEEIDAWLERIAEAWVDDNRATLTPSDGAGAVFELTGDIWSGLRVKSRARQRRQSNG